MKKRYSLILAAIMFLAPAATIASSHMENHMEKGATGEMMEGTKGHMEPGEMMEGAKGHMEPGEMMEGAKDHMKPGEMMEGDKK